MTKKFSHKTVARALLYIRTLEGLSASGQELVSSQQLADLVGLTAVQVRKDLSAFGRFGKPRVGYQTQGLKKELAEFVRKHIVHAVIFGVGNLGAAILKFPGFHQENLQLVAAFDTDPRKIGQKINQVPIYSLKDAPRVIPQRHTEIGVIAVPPHESQKVADIMVRSGLRGIVNFSPTMVSVPKGVLVKNIDLSIEFMSLFCNIQH